MSDAVTKALVAIRALEEACVEARHELGQFLRRKQAEDVGVRSAPNDHPVVGTIAPKMGTLCHDFAPRPEPAPFCAIEEPDA